MRLADAKREKVLKAFKYFLQKFKKILFIIKIWKKNQILADRAKSSSTKKRQGSLNGTQTRLNGTFDSGSELQNNSRGSSGYRAGSGQINGSFTKNEKRYNDEEEEHRQKILNRVIF